MLLLWGTQGRELRSQLRLLQCRSAPRFVPYRCAEPSVTLQITLEGLIFSGAPHVFPEMKYPSISFVFPRGGNSNRPDASLPTWTGALLSVCL